MAKAFRSVTDIKGGRNGKDGVEYYEFKQGDVVTGLTKEEMKHLWDNGALEEVDVLEVEKPAKETPKETPKPAE
jgi:hypothetical protein